MQRDQHPRDTDLGEGHPEWFRAPTRRERWLAAGLFVSFGLFFVVLFFVNRGWWFRWIILSLGIISVWYGVRHLAGARQLKE